MVLRSARIHRGRHGGTRRKGPVGNISEHHGFPGFPDGEFEGRAAYKAFFRTFQESFSELEFDTAALHEAAGYVSAHWSIEATFSGAFAGIAPDRRRVHFDGVAVYRMEDGLIAETWLSFPTAMLLAQLPAEAARAA